MNRRLSDRRDRPTVAERVVSTAVRRAVSTAALASTLLVGTVAAHDEPATVADGTLSVGAVVALAVGLSLLGGVAVARYVSTSGRETLVRAVGALLVVLGGSAVVVALTERLVVAVVAAVVGMAIAVDVAHGRRLGGCADATFGAVLLHRCLEGALLATAATADLAFGLVGAVVVAGHATAETCAVGGLYAAETRRRALLAVGAVQAAFVGGAFAGSAVLSALSPAVRVFLFGLVGGVLLAVGVVEVGTDRATVAGESMGQMPEH
ncbi:hypothetical protein SAMN04487948_104271 [Halogranum amylolyticum]|uniref:Uncharacterized protein n=1 Tax=Halogranum amylolyticum TaxID=660520 RepID=A0A1H8RWF0_9EURY|nr:hypothetical protein [Halogranum amylolyticum]SEO70488.1 hypothetical protein SAMN04487948_104271 [Halogranum amylolyticum]